MEVIPGEEAEAVVPEEAVQAADAVPCAVAPRAVSKAVHHAASAVVPTVVWAVPHGDLAAVQEAAGR